MVKELEAPDAATRCAAALDLGLLGPDARVALPSLINALRDEDASVRKFATRALGGIGDRTAVTPLLEQLWTIEAWGSRLQAGGLSGQGLAAPLSAEVIRRQFTEVYHETTEALRNLGTVAVPGLLEGLRGQNPRHRFDALEVFSKMGPEAVNAVPDLIVALRDPDLELARRAASALGAVGPKAQSAVSSLEDAFRSPIWRKYVSPEVNPHHALLNPVPFVSGPAIPKGLTVDGWMVWWILVKALTQIQPGGSSVLLEAFRTEDDAFKRQLVRALDWPNTEGTIPILRVVAADGDWQIKREAEEALREVESKRPSAATPSP